MPEYPVQISKVQAPPLREETLERVRLLDWLRVKVHRRVVLVIAEAGYGKTTLLADFTRRTRVRTLWFRLDRGDRDWAGIIAHLVAAVRIHLPDFAPVTRSLLRDIGGSGPPRDAVLDTFIRELGDLPNDPTALVLDDVHAVDDSIDVRHILRELLARAPERLTFVLISRKVPPIPLARLRALGEVGELRTTDLRFDAGETEQLFRQTYALELEPSVVAELSRRTEGWAASLQLVRTAIRDRTASEIRAFVHSLSGGEGDLYDYLAEEVIGELSSELQQFLMRTSILDTVEPILGGVAAEISPTEARAAIAEGELLGLFSRTGPQRRDRVRAHPLVRDFLIARLDRSMGPSAVAGIHRAVAVAAEAVDWEVAGFHYLAAADFEDARRVLAGAIESILAAGAYAAAKDLATALPAAPGPDANVLVVLSRIAQQSGDSDVGRELAEDAFALEPRKTAVVMNVVTARMLAGDITGALDPLQTLEGSDERPSIGAMAQVLRSMIGCSYRGRLGDTVSELETLIGSLQRQSEIHYLGVAQTNLAYVLKGQGRADDCLKVANDAIGNLESTSSGIELVSARLVRAWALAHNGDLTAARAEVDVASRAAPYGQAVEVAYEAGEIELLYGDPARALAVMRPHEQLTANSDQGEQAALVRMHADLVTGDPERVSHRIRTLAHGALRTSVAFEVRRQLLEATFAWFSGDAAAGRIAATARDLATSQGAHLWVDSATILVDATNGQSIDHTVWSIGGRDPSMISIGADVVASRLGDLLDASLGIVRSEAMLRPERWRPPLRRALLQGSLATQLQAGRLLDVVGSQQDIALLRGASRRLRSFVDGGRLGRGLARRLAPHVHIEDLGRVQARIGDRTVDGASVRRKVLALLTFLATRPGFSATREEVLDAMWPDLAPSTALNSLNQTVYFLRRVFEPEFSEDLTAGYIGQDGETVWLDPELVSTRSGACREMIRGIQSTPAPDDVLRLARAYSARFALDFMYEDWAADYRDSLHTAFLRVAEAAIRLDTDTGNYSRGIEIAERAAEVEPDSEDLQVALLRLYRFSGSLAAAAEQYGHYAQSLRDIGVEPRPFSAL